MKKLLLTLLVTLNVISFCSAQQAFYDVTASNGNGVRFWGGSDNYKIHFGNTSEYHFGPVTDYSIKMNMDVTSGRGWTWGIAGQTPVAAIGSQGNMQIAGTFLSGTITAKGALSVEETVLNATNFSDQDFNVRISAAGASTKRTMIGPSSTGRFSLGVGTGNEYLTLLNGGYVGIGTTSPQSTLDVRGNIALENGTDPILYTGEGSTELNRYMLLLNSTGLHSASGLKAGGALIADSYAYANPGKNDLIVKGNVGIGTTQPDYPLTVNGSIHAKEVRVDLSVPAPDYVFEKNYKLTSLEDIKNYIDQNKHLPEVPSAKEIEKNGLQLGEMNMILLKKIEELTLHVIELKQENKKLNQQQTETAMLKSQLEMLTKKIDSIDKKTN